MLARRRRSHQSLITNHILPAPSAASAIFCEISASRLNLVLLDRITRVRRLAPGYKYFAPRTPKASGGTASGASATRLGRPRKRGSAPRMATVSAVVPSFLCGFASLREILFVFIRGFDPPFHCLLANCSRALFSAGSITCSVRLEIIPSTSSYFTIGSTH